MEKGITLKNHNFCKWLIVSVFCVAINVAFAQEKTIDKAFKTATIERLNQLMTDNYVFPDVAKETAAHLSNKLESGYFDTFNELQTFANALTEEVQAINKDKHMRIRPTPPREAPEQTTERLIEDHLHMLAAQQQQMAGFQEAKRLEGNIGYLDLRGFANPMYGAPVADHYMALLSKSDAIIIDLRKNGGGSPEMVQYLCSYFFDKHVHLNSLYWRQGDETREFWTLDEVNGKKMPDVPLFIVTSSYTFSGAEEFSYNMQTRKRATLVGETTGGGANPGGGFRINSDLMVFIPTGRAINPVTGTNWEGVGVVPEVKVEAEKALDKAIELATEAANEYRESRRERNKKLLTDLYTEVDKLKADSPDDQVIVRIKACHDEGIMEEADINSMGYYFLRELENSVAAEAILKANTKLYPASANAFDSYGEALLANKKMEAALKSYQKAVEIAEASNDANLELFKENFANAKQMAKKQPKP